MAWFTEFRADDALDPIMVCFYSTLRYRLAVGSALHVEQEAAWCARCRSFGIAEVLPWVEELRGRLQELRSPTKVHYVLFRTVEGIGAAMDELRARLKWRQSRESPARYLAYGSTEVGPGRFGEDRSCVVNRRRLVETGWGFADSANWVAGFSPEGRPSVSRCPV